MSARKSVAVLAAAMMFPVLNLAANQPASSPFGTAMGFDAFKKKAEGDAAIESHLSEIKPDQRANTKFMEARRMKDAVRKVYTQDTAILADEQIVRISAVKERSQPETLPEPELLQTLKDFSLKEPKLIDSGNEDWFLFEDQRKRKVAQRMKHEACVDFSDYSKVCFINSVMAVAVKDPTEFDLKVLRIDPLSEDVQIHQHLVIAKQFTVKAPVKPRFHVVHSEQAMYVRAFKQIANEQESNEPPLYRLAFLKFNLISGELIRTNVIKEHQFPKDGVEWTIKDEHFVGSKWYTVSISEKQSWLTSFDMNTAKQTTVIPLLGDIEKVHFSPDSKFVLMRTVIDKCESEYTLYNMQSRSMIGPPLNQLVNPQFIGWFSEERFGIMVGDPLIQEPIRRLMFSVRCPNDSLCTLPECYLNSCPMSGSKTLILDGDRLETVDWSSKRNHGESQDQAGSEQPFHKKQKQRN